MNIREQLWRAKYGPICNLGGRSEQSNATTSANQSNTTTTNTSYNTSNNVTSNLTNTLTQDRRLVTDHGIGLSTDNSTVGIANSGNSTTSSVDSHANSWMSSLTDNSNRSTNWSDSSVRSNINSNNTYNNISTTTTDFGAVSSAIGANSDVALHTVAAGEMLGQAGADMLNANLQFLQHVSDSNTQAAAGALQQVANSSAGALNEVAALAAKPMNANDPQHILVIVGLVVFGIFAMKGFKV